MSVNGTSAYRTLKDLLDAARAKPGSVNMASIGPGTPFDIGLAVLKRAAGADITFVPFNGNGPSINALLGDQSHWRPGRLRAPNGGNSTLSQEVKDGLLP